MIVSDEGQAKVFLIYILFGMLCIMLSNLFFVLKKRFGVSGVKINILDGIYYILVFLIIFYAGVRFNLGALRYYQIMALLLGMAIYKLFFSRMVVKVIELAVNALLKLTGFVFKCIWRAVEFVLRGFFSLAEFFERKIMRVCHKARRYTDKVKVKREKKKKTVKKRLKMI